AILHPLRAAGGAGRHCRGRPGAGAAALPPLQGPRLSARDPRGRCMKYPPLPDPESPTPGPAAAPPGSDPGRSPSSGSVELPAPKGAPAAEPEPSGTSAPGADTAREGRAAPPPDDPGDAPPDAGADGEADTPIYA